MGLLLGLFSLRCPSTDLYEQRRVIYLATALKRRKPKHAIAVVRTIIWSVIVPTKRLAPAEAGGVNQALAAIQVGAVGDKNATNVTSLGTLLGIAVKVVGTAVVAATVVVVMEAATAEDTVVAAAAAMAVAMAEIQGGPDATPVKALAIWPGIVTRTNGAITVS